MLTNIINGKGLSLTPQLHIQQIGLFLWKQGIELFPSEETARDFIAKQWEENQTELHLWDIWEQGAKSGGILLYIRPNGESYSLDYYPQNNYQIYFDSRGNLASATINTETHGEKSHYHRLKITAETIETIESNRAISNTDTAQKIPNPYNFIPLIYIANRPQGKGKLGLSEFTGLEGQIEALEWLADQVHGNAEFFGGPIFYSSRSKAEMVEAGMIETRTDTLSEQGYGYKRQSERIKARRIVDNLEDGEQIGFATPSPIPDRILEYLESFEGKLRAALGGVDENAINGDSGIAIRQAATRAIATSKRKSKGYITHGICKAYELMLKMAIHDKILPKITNTKINWRYLGDVFEESPNDKLTRSIVSRNLLRMGVSARENLKWLFPDHTEEEIDRLLENGFPYEYINGIAGINERIPLDLTQLIEAKFLNEQAINRESIDSPDRRSRSTSNTNTDHP